MIDLEVDEEDTEFYHRCDYVFDLNTGNLIENLHLVYVELQKFRIGIINKDPMFDIWLRYLTEINEKTKSSSEDLSGNPLIQKALSIIEE